MCSPKPPAPTPIDTGAQTRSNIQTATAQSQLDNPNIVNPYGSTRYSMGEDIIDNEGYQSALRDWENSQSEPRTIIGHGQTGNPIYSDDPIYGRPTTSTPRPSIANYTTAGRQTMTQEFSPEQQKIFEAEQANKLGLQGLSGQGIESMKGLIGTKVDLSGAPAAPQQNEALRKKVIDAMMSRTGGALTRASDQQDSDLIAAGIRPGTEAWDRVKGEQGRNRNDALMQAELAGQGAVESSFGMDDASRKNYIAELLTQRSVPLNEITALMSGSQVSNPFAGQGYRPGANISPVDMGANTNMLNQYNQNVYNQDMAQRNALIGAGAMVAASDRRLKENIKRIATNKLGIGVYTWKYIDYMPKGMKSFVEKGMHGFGVMADEVRKVMPEAVITVDGYDSVNYSMLGDWHG